MHKLSQKPAFKQWFDPKVLSAAEICLHCEDKRVLNLHEKSNKKDIKVYILHRKAKFIQFFLETAVQILYNHFKILN